METAVTHNLAHCLHNMPDASRLQAACSLALDGISCAKQQY